MNELYVDDPDKDSGGKIDVSLNISLPNLHCECEYSSRPLFQLASLWVICVQICCAIWGEVNTYIPPAANYTEPTAAPTLFFSFFLDKYN